MVSVDEHGAPWCQRATCDVREELAKERALNNSLKAAQKEGWVVVHPSVIQGYKDRLSHLENVLEVALRIFESYGPMPAIIDEKVQSPIQYIRDLAARHK